MIRPGRSFRLLAYQRMNPSVGDPEIQNGSRKVSGYCIQKWFMVVSWGIFFKGFPTFKCFRERKLTCRVAIPSDIGWYPSQGDDRMIWFQALKRSSWLKNHSLDMPRLSRQAKKLREFLKRTILSQVRPTSHRILSQGHPWLRNGQHRLCRLHFVALWCEVDLFHCEVCGLSGCSSPLRGWNGTNWDILYCIML